MDKRWHAGSPAMPVDLNRIRDEEFRFFENRHFDFLAE